MKLSCRLSYVNAGPCETNRIGRKALIVTGLEMIIKYVRIDR